MCKSLIEESLGKAKRPLYAHERCSPQAFQSYQSKNAIKPFASTYIFPGLSPKIIKLVFQNSRTNLIQAARCYSYRCLRFPNTILKNVTII